jgi:hypothetical protein
MEMRPVEGLLGVHRPADGVSLESVRFASPLLVVADLPEGWELGYSDVPVVSCHMLFAFVIAQGGGELTLERPALEA